MDRSPVDQAESERADHVLTEKHAFVLRALGEMAEHTFPFICSVVAVENQKMGRLCGSALRCILGNRRAIITANHVLEEARTAPRGIAISTGNGRLPYTVHDEIQFAPSADVAVYYLPDEYPDAPLWPSTRIDRSMSLLSSDFLFIHGFPGKTTYPSMHLNGVNSKSLPYGAMRRLDELPPSLQPFQFAVEYDPAGMVDQTGATSEAVDPHGLSGAPVWRIGASGRPTCDWQPGDSLLVGVLTGWSATANVLVASSIQKLPSTW